MTDRRNHLILVALITLALVGVGLLAIPGSPFHKKPVLGLDLQGGLEVVLQAVPEEGQTLTEDALDRSEAIIRNRIDALGVAEPEVRKQGDDQISVQLAGVRNADEAARLIGTTAKLELYDLETGVVGPSGGGQGSVIAFDNLPDLLSPVQAQVDDDGSAYYLVNTKTKRTVAGPFDTRQELLESREVTSRFGDELPAGFKVFGVPKNMVVITCSPTAPVCPGVQEAPPTRRYYYLFKYQPNHPRDPVPEMTGDDLVLKGTQQDFDTRTGEPIVSMQFTDEGAEKFGDITAAEATRGRLYGTPQHFAIVLDRDIKSWPQIDYTEYPAGIQGSSGAQITGLDSIDEARNIAIVLQSGALPINFQTLEQTEISATLGEDSLKQAQRAALAGLLVVALFLLIAYRFLGLVAVLGLGIYAAFMYAAILVFNVTLTLPGFAGMILTIGVAADANIVIFERIKEESRAGKSVRAAISAGYGKGFSTIVDANVVTAITALVLFAFATAGVKGFALMLLIGTAMSIVTAVAATRAMLGLLAGFRWFDSPQFMGAQGQQTARWLQIDYIGKRRLWFALSGVVLAVAVGAIAFKGLNLGIDFRGGTEVSFKTPKPTDIADVRDAARRAGHAAAIIQGRGAPVAEDTYRSFEIRADALDREEQSRLMQRLEESVGATSPGVNTVSASFGQQIAKGALYAILFSLFLVAGYISLRFEWKFALAAMVALVHDVLIAVGIYSLLDREVTTATVAAILTVLGYSIYDTIIILDRVRENIPLMRRASIKTIGNISLWETIRRSLATTFITLLPITALYFFGGDTLKDFAFALLIGIGSGAYSSIFIAPPLVAFLKEREPEYARRRDDADQTATDGTGVLEDATAAAADEPVPALAPLTPAERTATNDAKRERRRQRRRARPHGRAR